MNRVVGRYIVRVNMFQEHTFWVTRLCVELPKLEAIYSNPKEPLTLTLTLTLGLGHCSIQPLSSC